MNFKKKLYYILKSLDIHVCSVRYIDWNNKKRYTYLISKIQNKLIKKYKDKQYPNNCIYAVPLNLLKV